MYFEAYAKSQVNNFKLCIISVLMFVEKVTVESNACGVGAASKQQHTLDWCKLGEFSISLIGLDFINRSSLHLTKAHCAKRRKDTKISKGYLSASS